MWPRTFETRLSEWHALRLTCQGMDLESALLTINSWWFQTPWRPYYLHLDDHRNWPNPWELLADNVFCDVARALGIVYTIHLLERTDISKVEIAESDRGNLVLVQGGEYILNWEPEQLLNIASADIKIKKSLSSDKFIHLLG